MGNISFWYFTQYKRNYGYAGRFFTLYSAEIQSVKDICETLQAKQPGCAGHAGHAGVTCAAACIRLGHRLMQAAGV
jgi:hypothetical protein